MQAPPATPGGPDELAADWRALDMRARLAEEELRSAWIAWFDRRGPMPPADLVAQARQRRQAADDSLARAVQARKAAGF